MKFIKHLHVNQKIINLSFKNIYIGRVSYHLAKRILLLGQRAPAASARPSVCSVSYLVFGPFVCFALVCLNTSPPFIQLLLFVQGTSVSSKRPLKFRNVLKYSDMSESRSSLSSKHQRIPTALKVFLGFENDNNRSSTKTFTQRTWKSTEELSTMSKNNFRRIRTYMGDSLFYLDNLLTTEKLFRQTSPKHVNKRSNTS